MNQNLLNELRDELARLDDRRTLLAGTIATIESLFPADGGGAEN